MAWIYLFTAGLFEIGWAVGLKYTDGYTKLIPTVLTVIGMIISVVLLGLAAKTLPIGTAYAVWTGIGIIGAALWGIFVFGEPATATRLLFLGLVIVGIVGLKFTSSE